MLYSAGLILRRMSKLVKQQLEKHKYLPEGKENAVQTLMSQYEVWTDNVMTIS